MAVNSHRRYTQNSQNAPSTHLQTELYARFVNHVLSPHVYLFMWMYSTFLFAHVSSRRCRITCLCCVWGGNKKSWRPAIYEIRFLFLFFRFLFLIFSYFSYIDLLYKGVPQGESRSSNRIRAVRKKKTNFISAFRTEKSNMLNIVKIHMYALNVLVSSSVLYLKCVVTWRTIWPCKWRYSRSSRVLETNVYLCLLGEGWYYVGWS